MTEPTGESRPKRPVVVPALALITATALGITALLGGFDEVPAVEPATMAEGGKVDQVLYETQFLESKITLQRAANEFAEDKRYLDVLLKVTNKGEETAWVGTPWKAPDKPGAGYGVSLQVKEPKLGTEPDMFVPGEARSTQLHPGVPTTVVLRYELPEAAAAPEKVVLSVASFEEVEDEYDGSLRWDLAGEKVTKPDPFTKEGLLAPLTGKGRPQSYNMVTPTAVVTLKVKQEAS
ncbi:hypothetical protein [Thermoactinospora rubra]|uniref:hypothetical protein n=1 Tax=Thermoactinospora rubra TaxID=1088767 RepID=UPI000A121186|nr:hypothetical protein [Thermoactinospora rubra]